MRFLLSASIIAASLSFSAAFTPSSGFLQQHQEQRATATNLCSSIKQRPAVADARISTKKVQQKIDVENHFEEINDASNEIVPLTGEEINARLGAQLEKLREKDRTSRKLEKEV